jgi:hypothetical protein
MNLEAYNVFLKTRLNEVRAPLTENILNSLSNLEDKRIYRLVGSRDVLNEVINGLDGLLKDFYNTNKIETVE